jgi:hypothetical protein
MEIKKCEEALIKSKAIYLKTFDVNLSKGVK